MKKDLILGIAHTGHFTAQMDKMLEFYCDKLGFKHAFSIKDEDGNNWIEYIKLADNSFIELFYSSPEKVAGPDVKYHHICIRVRDIHEVAEHLNANGVPIIWGGPSMGKDKNWQCWCEDPDGNKIEFMYISPESPQAKA
ncbi:MAG: VOC family protein [Oscillospiraceae bacterium]|nr:VOC family protein [Oscillospiraceae bacterium]